MASGLNLLTPNLSLPSCVFSQTCPVLSDHAVSHAIGDHEASPLPHP